MTVTMMSPTWYDLLDVDPSSSADEIRAAWKAAIADLDPTDRRFRTLNEAAAVLLDKEKRAAYDDALAAQERRDAQSRDAEDAEATDQPTDRPTDRPTHESTVALTKDAAIADAAAPDADVDAPADADTDDGAQVEPETEQETAARPRGGVPAWVLATVAVLAVAALVAAIVTFVRGGTEVVTAENRNATTSTLSENYGAPITKDHTTLIEEDAQDALAAAKEAVVPLLSYDYRKMDAVQRKAHTYMTATYRKEYDRVFAVLKDNVGKTKTVVKALPPIDAGIVRVSEDRVQVLIFLDRPTTNVKTTKPIPYQDYVTLTMVKQDGKWLVDGAATKPASS